jgi:hypothetical protein
MASPDTDYVVGMFLPWLENIAKNTADALKVLKGSGGTGPAPATTADGSRFERAMEALGKRFESALSQWSRTPVEKLVNSAFDAATKNLDRAANSLIGQGRGLINRGMQGTVEQARNDYAMEQLGRQMAGIFAPLTNALTYFASRTTALLGSMNGDQQNRMMGLGVGAYAGMRMGGVPGMIAGGTIGALAMGGESSIAGGLTGAYLGARLAGPVGAVAGYAIGAVSGSGDYGRLRGEGNSRLAAVAGAGIGAVTDLGYGAARMFGLTSPDERNPMDAIRKEANDRAVAEGRRPGPAPKREVTPFQAQMGEAGSTAMRVQEGLIRATAGEGFDDAGPLKPIIDWMERIFVALMKLADPTYVPPPSADGARYT